MGTDDSAEKLSNAYSTYLKIDNQKEMNKLDECIEDTLTRLEELESGIKMFQNEREKFGSIDFTVARCNLNALCQRVHKLDVMSKRVLEDVEALEPVVDKAESNLTNNTEAKLKSLLKPLFFMKSDTSSPSTLRQTSTPQFTPPSTFQTSSFFPKQDEDPQTSSST